MLWQIIRYSACHSYWTALVKQNTKNGAVLTFSSHAGLLRKKPVFMGQGAGFTVDLETNKKLLSGVAQLQKSVKLRLMEVCMLSVLRERGLKSHWIEILKAWECISSPDRFLQQDVSQCYKMWMQKSFFVEAMIERLFLVWSRQMVLIVCMTSL